MIALFFTGITFFIVSIYMIYLRPRQLQWGSSELEYIMPLPGDLYLFKPDFNATRSITIYAEPSEIWKWIIQIGSKRAGWYSIDWIDNRGVKSSGKILPEHQQIYEGQFIPLIANQKKGMWVCEFRDNDYVVWNDKKGMASWTWKIIPAKNGSSRLITRLRVKYVWNNLWIFFYLI